MASLAPYLAVVNAVSGGSDGGDRRGSPHRRVEEGVQPEGGDVADNGRREGLGVDVVEDGAAVAPARAGAAGNGDVGGGADRRLCCGLGGANSVAHKEEGVRGGGGGGGVGDGAEALLLADTVGVPLQKIKHGQSWSKISNQPGTTMNAFRKRGK